jgi:hypothetical protein
MFPNSSKDLLMSQVRMYIMGTMGLEIQTYGIAILDGYGSFYVPIPEESEGRKLINGGINILKEVIEQIVYQEEHLNEDECEASRLFEVLENIKNREGVLIDNVWHEWDEIRHLFDIPLFKTSNDEDVEELDECPECGIKLILVGNNEECPNCGKMF